MNLDPGYGFLDRMLGNEQTRTARCLASIYQIQNGPGYSQDAGLVLVTST